ncbi:MAG: D-2-hydroxyacid dehydrogenase [Spirochaetia bacterium]|nr:D-2-hydroxyacid dehydrogenase [Spirochaetia bacterium]
MNIVSTVQLSDENIEYIYSKTHERVSYIDKMISSLMSIENIEILLARDRDITISLLEEMISLKMIFIVSTGVEKIPFKYLQERNIMVANTTGVSEEAMSNYVIGALLSFSSNFLNCFHYKNQRHWQKYLCTEPLVEKKLLICGAGKIGRKIAEKAKAFKIRTIGIKTKIEQVSYFDEIYDMTAFEKQLREADYTVCCLPLTKQTYKLFNANVFSMMKQSSVFINISRGGLVDEDALIVALEDNQIKGAVLDVFETEPLPKESKLWDLDNVILTPHSSGRIHNFLDYSIHCFCNNLISYKTTGRLVSPIDLDKGY